MDLIEKEYKKMIKEGWAGNFYSNKSAIKETFKSLKIIEQVQKYFEKLNIVSFSSLTAEVDSKSTIIGWKLYFSYNIILDPPTKQKILNDILSISSKLSKSNASDDLSSFLLKI